MALDIIAALQGGTCATTQTERWVFIPNESTNLLFLLNHIKTQMNTLSDLIPDLKL